VDNESLVLDSELINYLMALWPKGSDEKAIYKGNKPTYEDLFKRLGNKLSCWEQSMALYFELSFDYKPSQFVKSGDDWQIIFLPVPYCEVVYDGTSVWSYDDHQSDDHTFGTRVLEILGTNREAKIIKIAAVEQMTMPVLCRYGPKYLEKLVEKRAFWQLVSK